MRATFKAKAMLFVISILVVVSVIYTYQSIRSEKELIRKEIIKRAAAITTLATKAGELPIFSGNAELMKGAVGFLMANVEVSSVAFYDAGRKLLVQDGQPAPPLVPELPAGQTIIMREQGDSFVFFAPVTIAKSAEGVDYILNGENARQVKENIGWVRLGFSKSPMWENEQEIATRGVLLAGLFIIVGSILLYVLISVALRPLGLIVQVAEAIAHGDLSRHVQIDQRDEIGALAAAVQTMRDEIRHVLQETNGLIEAVGDGRLETRGNAEAFEGGWRDLVTGINQLTDAFAGVNQELTVAKEAAESASRAKSLFLSSMSHELRTPLNAILGYAQILRRQHNLTEPQRQQLEIMQVSGEHLLTLINDVLDLGRIEADKMTVEEVNFDLPALLKQVYHLTSVGAHKKGLNLEFRLETPLPPYVFGDERKVRQILLNLLANAVKYTEQGSVVLQASYGTAGEAVFRCEVRDTGVGIPEDKLESIFEPFTQLGSEGLISQGTGLGLSISKRLLALLGGRIGVESQAGQGSSFWFELALPSVAAAPSEVPLPWQQAAVESKPAPEEVTLVPPSAEELDRLYHLAMMGDLLQIAALAAELETREPRYAPFAGRLRELSEGCKARAVLALVTQYRGDGR
jgi:signal transduction histidine kinase